MSAQRPEKPPRDDHRNPEREGFHNDRRKNDRQDDYEHGHHHRDHAYEEERHWWSRRHQDDYSSLSSSGNSSVFSSLIGLIGNLFGAKQEEPQYASDSLYNLGFANYDMPEAFDRYGNPRQQPGMQYSSLGDKVYKYDKNGNPHEITGTPEASAYLQDTFNLINDARDGTYPSEENADPAARFAYRPPHGNDGNG